ncbi:transcription factor EC-like [Ruditapes philippinarum]|uniref:transcription factor EC-like n=1 Tax=Ruditapes philippinarum TaxID=129788 RepID=UPI00295A5A5B|nr:transcription factor EC-like [Ruditapes philippinarum]
MSFINEKIKELGDLLPENAKRRSCQTKGLILQKSVEYLKILRKDKDIIQPLLLKIQKLDAEMVTLSEKIQQLDNQMQIQETGFLDYAKVSHAASPYHLYDQP